MPICPISGSPRTWAIAQGLTETGSIVGSPGYLSPEQVQSEALSPQTDIYSLGVMLYELLVGQHPFPDTPVGGLIDQTGQRTAAIGLRNSARTCRRGWMRWCSGQRPKTPPNAMGMCRRFWWNFEPRWGRRRLSAF